MPQLDALRAFAVGAVLLVHFGGHAPGWFLSIPWAALGVELFFVLSGFLITGILLDARTEAATNGSVWWTLRQFYIRRFLRIFPLYYFVIFIGRLIRLDGFVDTFGWNLAYLTNFYIARKGDWIGAASHLWTLSVEEQFYLVWPWIVLFLPRRWLLGTFIMAMVSAVAYRLLAFQWFGPWLNVMPVASSDCFGAGALLALGQRWYLEGRPQLRRTLCVIGLCAGVPLLITAMCCAYSASSIMGRLRLVNVSTTFLFIPLISGAANGFTGAVGMLLNQSWLRYIGKISYGIYVYHLPIAWSITHSRWSEHLPRFLPHPLLFLVLTISVATFSWHLFERPINQLKRLFPYSSSIGRSVAFIAPPDHEPTARF